MFEFIIGVGDIIVVPPMVFVFVNVALRLFAFEVVLSLPPRPKVPAAIKSEAVIMVFLMVLLLFIQK